MSGLLDKAQQYQLNRRTFLGLAAATTAGLALTGCSSGQGGMKTTAAAGAEETGKWVTAACWHNCGGRCLNKALVNDGIVTRMKTDDLHADSPDFPQQRGCSRGRSHRQHVLGADRLKYPMKRKNWAPGGGKKELRGKDEWVRISWDEALDIAASEIKRIKEKYGNQSMLVSSGSELPRALNLIGGYCVRWGAVSWGAWPEVYPKITGIAGNGANSGNDRFRLRKSKLIILWGANPAWSSMGTPMYNLLQAKKAGAKFIVVDPIHTETVRVLADDWIPVRPATDTALLLGMAHHMITNKLHDQAFLDKYCVGFDADHMPKGADPKNNFKDYVLGTHDGKPKTPEWAAEICGVSAAKIRSFAEEFAKTQPTAVITAGASARINNGEHLPHAMMTVTFMTGNVGIPGSGVSPNMHNRSTYAGPNLVSAGSAGVPNIPNPIAKVQINNCELWSAVLTGKYTDGPGPKKDINIQMIAHGSANDLNQRAGLAKGIQAHRKVEFVLTQNLFLTTTARYADLVLPVTSQWERFAGLLTGNREILIYHKQVINPLYEAKDDMWIATEIAKRLGVDAAKVNPLSEKQQMFNQLAGSTVMKPDGSGTEKLLTITAEDIAAWGVTGTPQNGRITLKEFEEKGIYQVPRTPGDKLEFTEFEAFRNDPVKNPLKTPSGKLQIYSQELADHIRSFGFNEKDPIAKYDPSIEGYEWTKKGEFPLQLITIHHLRRSHSTMDNVPWLREAFDQNVWINPVDANARNLKVGDIVKVFSKHGAVIRPVYVTERIMPGVVALGEGAWVEMDEEAGVDKAGATNMLNGDYATGQGHTGHNSCVVQVEKYNKPLTPDAQWPQRIVL
ncbi:MAG TPA: molybdopterin-dependent oxidoreductase [Symbiobacteriaceae bacterium]|nr:molybdopterin-dependent oxidoreductase [Symbiobacteriaceae bacterium]